MYSNRIKEKKYPWGGRVLATLFPAHGSVSLVGSIKGGSRAAGTLLRRGFAGQGEEFADVHAQMLLEGTQKRSKKEIQQMLDDIGASLSFSASDSRLIFSGKALARNLPKLLALIGEILAEPAFPSPELAILKNRELADLAHEAQDTRAQAGIALDRLLYPKSHPNFSETTEESRTALKSITGASLHAFHKKILGRTSLVLSIAGDTSSKQVFALAEKYFKTLPDREVSFKHCGKPNVARAAYRAVPIAHKASVDYMAGIATGITNDHKDHIPLMLGMQILGTPGFAGRMMKTIREQEGLTYGVYSYCSGFQRKIDGNLSVWGTFSPQFFKRGRAAIKREIALIAGKGVTDEETKKHRELFYNKSRVQMSTSSAFARAAHAVAVEGRPLSYLDEFPKKVLKTSSAQVNRALKKYLLPNKLSEAAAGPVSKKSFGKM